MFGKKLGFLYLLIFFTQCVQGQLSNFILNVTKTDVQCTSNGSLTFSVSNTTNGATMLYSVYLLPDVTTPISVQSALTISGLGAGNYRVVATQSLGNQSGSQQQDIRIIDLRNPLTYQISSSPEVCLNDGTITVNVINGTPVSYEIFSGPMTRPLQTSNTFTGLTAGVYQIRVFDNCNQGVVQTYTLLRANTALNFNLLNPVLASCNTVTIGFGFQSVVPTPGGVIKYPIQVTATVFPPSGSPIIYNQTITSGNAFSQQVPFYTNQPYNYSFTITDGCGTVYSLSGSIQNLAIRPTAYTVGPEDCVHKLVAFSNVSALTLNSAPSGYLGGAPRDFTSIIISNSATIHNLTAGTYVFTATDLCGNQVVFTIVITIENSGAPPFYTTSNITCIDASLFIFEIQQLTLVSCPPNYAVTLPHDYTSLINAANYAVFTHLPIGTYVFSVKDLCGNTIPMPITIESQSLPPTATVLEGCDRGVGSLQLDGQLLSISLISAPTAYNGTLPSNLTGSVISGGTKLSLDSLPPGTYVFQSTNSCNQTFTTNVAITGYQENTIATVTPNCGSFNFDLNHTSNNISTAYWLQKQDAITHNWGHPLTGVVYTDGSVPTNTNSVAVNNNSINYNLAYEGHFRILKVYQGFIAGTASPINCFKTIYEFDFSGKPKINTIYSVSCGTTFEVVVNAVGNSALTYRIISRNGQPFLIQNGSSSLFSGLIPAVYVFEVEDACHNTINGQFEVLNPNPLTITASSNLCDGASVSLTAPNFSFLTYQWWKGTNSATILSTTNSLNFPSYNSATNSGTYHVRISYSGNPNSCLNQVLDYTIPSVSAAPHAGDDNTVSYCGRKGIIDLNTLLTGSFDTTGTWTEITSSGTLNSNLWNSSTVSFATYRFKYTVSGTCSLVDDSLITINLKEIPQIPTTSADPIICETQDLNLFATTVSGVTYHWTGPNGFVSTLQNPVINAITTANNGTYSVYSEQNSCQSGTSDVTVLVHPLPDFVLNQGCVANAYEVWVTKTNEISYDETTSTFGWIGPAGFTSSQPTITITGGAVGLYSLTITNEHGCSTTHTIQVERNNCFIPNVITPNNDEFNQNFDLTGFGVSKLEIYSRWGRKVYEKNNYIDEWHGQNMNGGILPDSTYFYIIKLETDETKTGWIYLNRG